MIFKSNYIGISIDIDINLVYEFTSEPLNLPKWASGLSTANMKRLGNEWVTDSPMGQVKFRFAPKNEFGVLDHEVTLPNGEVVYNPLRVIKNGDGCELIFTLHHLPGRTEDEYRNDSMIVKSDLERLKTLLENKNQ